MRRKTTDHGRRTTDGGKAVRRPWSVVALVLILLLAAGLRLRGLGDKSLWMDEIFTVQKASMGFSGMMTEIETHDAHPPLFQIVEWLWLRLGRGDGFARVPAALAGIAGVWLAYAVARRLLDRRAALAAAFLMAVSCFHVYYSQEARLQTLAAALVLGQVLLLLRIVARRGRAGWGLWAGFGVLGLACLYTYALCVLTVGAVAALYLILARGRRRQWQEWLIVHAAMGLLFLPWVPTMRATTAKVQASAQRAGDEIGRPSAMELAHGAATWVMGPIRWKEAPEWGAGLGVGLVAAGAVALLTRRSRRPAIALGWLFLAPLVGYLLLPMPRVHEYDPKHLIFLQPLLLMALCGVLLPRRQGLPVVFYVALMMGIVNAYGLSVYFHPGFQKEEWRALGAEVGERLHERDLVLFNPEYAGYPFDYYAHGAESKAGVMQLRTPGYTERYRRVWLVTCESAVARPIPGAGEALERLGWKREEEKAYPATVGTVAWALYVREAP